MSEGFGFLDWSVVLLYFIGTILVGIIAAGKQSSASDYFVSERKIHWLIVCFSIVATETSAITFISVPGLAFKGNFNFLQLALGYIIGRVVVALVLLPRYFGSELSTAYALIEKTFGVRLRRVVSGTFIITRIFADGVRVYAVSIPLVFILRGYHVFSGTDDVLLYVLAIATLSVATLTYVFFGGIRAVIWTDLVQLFVYLAGGVIAVFFLWHAIDAPLEKIVLAIKIGKLDVVSFDNMWTNSFHFMWALFGGAALSVASHGTDQIIVQRLFASTGLKESQKAMVWSGVIVLLQFTLFLFIGLLLYLFYDGDIVIKSDKVFAQYIVEALPAGVRGLIIAAILAAAMSTLSSSISAISNAAIFDFYINSRAGRMASEEKKMFLSKAISLIFFIILLFSALLFIHAEQSSITIALEVASFTYGSMLGLFILSIYFKEIKSQNVLISFFVGVVLMIVIVSNRLIPWTLYVAVGMCITVSVAWALNRLLTIQVKL